MGNALNLKSLPKKGIRAVFTDLDDTLTEKSKISPETYGALWKLKQKKFRLIIVSGRPAGWADCLMRVWPVDAMVFENGAGVMIREGERVRTICLASEDKGGLESIFSKLKRQIPNLKLATDQPYRRFDFAIDYCEEPPRLTQKELDLVLSALSSEPTITAKLSSIHVNFWNGKHTKVTACEYLLQDLSKDEVVYVGDSPNDEPLFSFFEHTVGVANIKKYWETMKAHPKYLTKSKGGKGFVELVEHLCT